MAGCADDRHDGAAAARRDCCTSRCGSPETAKASATRGSDAEIRKKYDREFRDGAVRIFEETGKPIAQVARDLGVNEGTLGNRVLKAREAREDTEGLSKGDIEELERPRAENAELRMERDPRLRSVDGRGPYRGPARRRGARPAAGA